MTAKKKHKTAEVDGAETLKKIEQRLSHLGDLPIFSATLNKVRHISSDSDSDAMSLAVEVMKDANLTTKLLQLANSSVYNRGLGKITIISRAVILLGFETIRSLCLTLKLIESFNTGDDGFDMNSMLVNAFLNAGMAREVAEKAGVKDIEQSYICGLLHGLGEIIVAYALPEKYKQMLLMDEKNHISWSKVQQQQLGLSFYTVGQKLGEQWGFSNNVIKTMQDYRSNSSKNLTDPIEINKALSSLSNSSLEVLFGKQNRQESSLGEIYQDMANAVGISRSDIEECMQQNFRNSCDLASDYGIDMKLLMPPVHETSDALLNKMSRQLSFYAGTRSTTDDEHLDEEQLNKDKKPDSAAKNKKDSSVSKKIAAAKSVIKKPKQKLIKSADLQVQLSILQDITGLISSSAGVHHVFAKVLEGIHKGLHFNRAVLCLLNADHSRLQVRLGVGENQDNLKKYFDLQVRDNRNLFIKILREGNELLVNDVNSPDWKNLVPKEFVSQVKVSSFSIAALRAGDRIVGLFYADMGTSGIQVNDELQKGFIQFVNQARLALQYSEIQRGK